MSQTILCTCYRCKAIVSCDVVDSEECSEEAYDDTGKVYLGSYDYLVLALRCQLCRALMMAVTTEPYDEGVPARMYPEPLKYLSHHIPANVRTVVEEARTCCEAKAYNACAVMCGRALEAICVEQGLNDPRKHLFQKLAELKEMGILDARMYRWSDLLKKFRNLGAHYTEVHIREADARQLLVFTEAMVEYLYVLHKKFEDFQKNLENKKKSKKATSASSSAQSSSRAET